MNKGGNSMMNYQTLIGFALVAIAIIIAAVIISGALNDFASFGITSPVKGFELTSPSYIKAPI